MAETKTRGNGPVRFTYDNAGDEDGVSSPRPLNPVRISFTDPSGKAVRVKLTDFDTATLHTFAALGMSKMVDNYVRNHWDDKPESILELVEEKLTEIREGKVFVRGGTGTARKQVADMSIYAEALQRAQKAKKQPITQEQADEFQHKLEAMSGKDRLAKINTLRKSVVYKQALMQVRMERDKAANKGKPVAEDMDLLSVI